jgi:hypothetical protein
MSNARARVLWTLFALGTIIIGTAIAIRFAQGYRPSRQSLVAGRGLLVANSSPTGARILVNGRFTSATNDTLYLDPGTYTVQIEKEGYLPWKKELIVEKELVTQANALLFPVAASLTPLSFSGAQSPVPSPDGQRLAYYSASASAETRNGYYVLELTDNPLALQRGSRQITRPSVNFPLGSTTAVWSPNSGQLLLVSPKKSVMLDPGKLNDLDALPDISFQLRTIFSQWEEEMYLRDRERLSKFPPLLQRVATDSAVNVYFSPDEKRLLYTAAQSFTLPSGLLPAKFGSNTQPEQRTTEPGGIYVYDREEDRQFRLGNDPTFTAAPTPAPTPVPRRGRPAVAASPTPSPLKYLLATDLASPRALSLSASPSAFTRLQSEDANETARRFRRYHTPLFTHALQWFPDSTHLISYDGGGVTVLEYDNGNQMRVYSGPFNQSFVYPWPNGSRLLMLTNFNQEAQVPENLYTIELR